MSTHPRSRMALLACLLLLLLSACSGGGGGDGGGGDDPGEAGPDPQANAAAAIQERSEAYVAEVKQWRAEVLAPVVTRVQRARFRELIVLNGLETPAQVRTQTDRCAFITATRRQAAALRAPALSGEATPGVTAFSDELTSATATYNATVVAALGEVQRYCTYYNAFITAVTALNSASDALDSAAKPGCEGTFCIPETPGPARELWIAALERFNEAEATFDAVEAGQSVACRFTRYDPLCRVLTMDLSRLNTVRDDLLQAYRSGTDRASLERELRALEEFVELLEQADQRARAAFASAFPDARVPASEDFYLLEQGEFFRHELSLLTRYETVARTATVPPGV